MLCAIDVLLHIVCILPLLPNPVLFLAEFLNVHLHLLGVENFLQVEESLVLEGKLLVLKDFIEVGGKLGCLKLLKA